MENLFTFEYETQNILNKNGTKSNFNTVYGAGGNVIHCKKDNYQVVSTKDLSILGHTFIDKNKDVKTFTHRDGEIIGLNINLGNRLTKVGEKTYNALITIPNNGGGKGFLTIKENRLICTNGAVHSESFLKEKSIKIPHNFEYKYALNLMEQSLIAFEEYITIIEAYEKTLNNFQLKETDVMFLLNKWFYENEMPSSHKEGLSFNDFRLSIVTNRGAIKCIERYDQLMNALKNEIQYCKELKIDISKYTVIASINNYLSRRIEKSNSSADLEIQFARQSAKVSTFDLTI